MTTSSATTPDPRDVPFVVTRVVNAPRALVFAAWTRPEHLVHWWGPKGFTLTVRALDLSPGGMFHYGMRAANGAEMFGRFIYHEISAPERLVFTLSFCDAGGQTQRHPLSPTWPLEMLNTVTFSEHDGRTTVTISNRALRATAAELATFRDGFASMQQGFGGTFDQLDAYLAAVASGTVASGTVVSGTAASDMVGITDHDPAIAAREIVTSRQFAAPRALVFRAWTEPRHLAKWWGPKGFTNTFSEFDLRPGGTWRFVMHGPDGTDYDNLITFTEITPPERLRFDHVSGHFFQVTADFAERAGGTHVTFRMRFADAAECERVKPFAAPGNEQNFDRLAAELATMA